ncbi:MAG: YgiQ family radical SAM protein, partial [Bacteroidales bacterium]|nr:YgiQ family radical SAM protein [Bacteroidales bacterium]
VMQERGYRVAIVPQPNWRDDLRDFRKLGAPRLFFGVTSGAMDSMINHYTANKRIRSNDAYTPEGKAGQRPDYAVNVYTQILKSLYPEVPVIIGGVEASLRRVTHYDYWQDKLLPSVLISSGADILVYGMGEKPILEIAAVLNSGASVLEVRNLRQIAFLAEWGDSGISDTVMLNSFEECCRDKMAFIENFNILEREADSLHPKYLIEPAKGKFVHVTPSYPPVKEKELDSFYDLPFTKRPHPRYRDKHIPAYEMIKFSINTHRGCFGSCAFCTISAHQGKFVLSRSEDSILREVKLLAAMEEFKGVISDAGGPTANMYGMGGRNPSLCTTCKRNSCVYPSVCKNLDISHERLLKLYKAISEVSGVKKLFIGSGIRYDLFLNEKGYLSVSGREYLKEVIEKHTSGRFKVAPEHTEEHVLKLMGKPSFKSFRFLREEFKRISGNSRKRYEIMPYFISGHPGCTIADMRSLASNPLLKDINTEQVQVFTPTPMTRSSIMYYTGLDTKTLKNIYIERSIEDMKRQKSFFFNKK